MANDLSQEMQTYEQMKSDLESKSMGKWILIHGTVLIGEYASFEETAEIAVKRFGRGPYLIRQVGSPPINLSAAVMYRISHA